MNICRIHRNLSMTPAINNLFILLRCHIDILRTIFYWFITVASFCQEMLILEFTVNTCLLREVRPSSILHFFA